MLWHVCLPQIVQFYLCVPLLQGKMWVHTLSQQVTLQIENAYVLYNGLCAHELLQLSLQVANGSTCFSALTQLAGRQEEYPACKH